MEFEKGVEWIDGVKHPNHKKGNWREFRILRLAIKIIKSQEKTAPEVFPYNKKSICASFTRACKFLEIEGMHFHDLRHEFSQCHKCCLKFTPLSAMQSPERINLMRCAK